MSKKPIDHGDIYRRIRRGGDDAVQAAAEQLVDAVNAERRVIQKYYAGYNELSGRLRKLDGLLPKEPGDGPSMWELACALSPDMNNHP